MRLHILCKFYLWITVTTDSYVMCESSLGSSERKLLPGGRHIVERLKL